MRITTNEKDSHFGEHKSVLYKNISLIEIQCHFTSTSSFRCRIQIMKL